MREGRDTYKQLRVQHELWVRERNEEVTWRSYLRAQLAAGYSPEQIAQEIVRRVGVPVTGKTVRLWKREMEEEAVGSPRLAWSS